jgi:hypothetical protein
MTHNVCEEIFAQCVRGNPYTVMSRFLFTTQGSPSPTPKPNTDSSFGGSDNNNNNGNDNTGSSSGSAGCIMVSY